MSSQCPYQTMNEFYNSDDQIIYMYVYVHIFIVLQLFRPTTNGIEVGM